MASPQARHWRSAADALAMLRRRQAMTRTELAGALGLRSGPASDLVKRLTRAGLLSERPAAQQGPGRPTTTLHGHPDGPVAVVLDLRHGDWRLGVCDAAGAIEVREAGRHDGSDPEALLATLGRKVGSLAGTLGDRAVGVGVAIPGLALDGRLTVTMLDWREVDGAALISAVDVPVLIGNDATMAAVAEARWHPGDSATLLHIVVEVGVGGAFVTDGRPAPSAHGMHGEFGHLPFGDSGTVCPCGAYGCWNTPFDVLEIARRTGLRPGSDPRAWLHRLYANPDESPTVGEVVTFLAAELGRGIAGLVNALDPGLVTLGGLAEPLRQAFPETFAHAFDRGLMTSHRSRAPRIVPAEAGQEATLVGAGLQVFDRVLDAELLARWAARGSRNR